MNELLLSRLAVRDYYAGYGVKHIYEKLGQDLSLVHMQLSVTQMPENELTGQIQQLVYDSIQGLRKLGRMMKPEQGVLASIDLAEQFQWVIGNELPGVQSQTKYVGNKPLAISEMHQLYQLACMIQIVLCVSKADVIVSAAELIYTERQTCLVITYAGAKIRKKMLVKDWLGQSESSGYLDVFDVQLDTSKNGRNSFCITLQLPNDL